MDLRVAQDRDVAADRVDTADHEVTDAAARNSLNDLVVLAVARVSTAGDAMRGPGAAPVHR
jgi:hypothetical protein